MKKKRHSVSNNNNNKIRNPPPPPPQKKKRNKKNEKNRLRPFSIFIFLETSEREIFVLGFYLVLCDDNNFLSFSTIYI